MSIEITSSKFAVMCNVSPLTHKEDIPILVDSRRKVAAAGSQNLQHKHHVLVANFQHNGRLVLSDLQKDNRSNQKMKVGKNCNIKCLRYSRLLNMSRTEKY